MTSMPFKTNKGFFEFSNAYLENSLKVGARIPALVPPPGFMNIENHVTELPDGRFRVSLVICGKPNGFFTIAETPVPGGKKISHGDLLLWHAHKAPPFFGKGLIGKLTGDKRSSWIGFIVAHLAPEIDTEGNIRILSKYQ